MKNFKSALLLILFLFLGCQQNQQAVQIEDGWQKVDEILSRIIPPTFPDKSFNIVELGAVANGKTDCLPFIQKAIEKCVEAGGGKVIIPKGEYFAKGPIHLKSNVNLHLDEGAVVNFSTEPKDYLPVVYTRWEGVECMNYSALVYAYDQKNIAVTGKGILNGQANEENWWKWKGRSEFGWEEGMESQSDPNSRPLLMKMNKEQVPVEQRIFGDGHFLRPNFIQFYKCQNILMEDFTVKDSPMWIIHPVFSQNITIRNVKSIGPGPNNDGCDPESCKDVLIENCYFDNGDDCIAIKSGRNEDGRRINTPSENIVVRNCEMKDGHGGIVIGSEISGGCKNVFLENCVMNSPNLDRAVRIKSNSYRGGTVENLFVRNVEVGEVGGAIVRMNMFYDPKEGDDGKFTPVFKNVHIKNIKSKKSKYGLRLEGLDNSPIENVIIEDCTFNGVDDGNIIKNVNGLEFKNFVINGEPVKK